MRIAPDRFKAEVVTHDNLAAEDAETWRALQSAEPAFANPLFGPEFFQIVGGARDDARVAVLRLHGQAVGFLPFHQRSLGLARAIGAPFSDYQGLVSKRNTGLSGRQALRLAGIKSFRFNGLIDPQGLFAGTAMFNDEAHAIVLDQEPADYLEAVRAASPKKFKNYRRLEHRLEREVGQLRLVCDDRSQATLDLVLGWKREQFLRTGLQDVLRPQWARQMMQSVFDSRLPGGSGLMMTLYAGETLVAAHFGIRSQTVYHPWIASANPALAAYSPGQLFLSHAVRAMPTLGLRVYDLGPGTDHYKRPYANLTHRPGAGLVTAPNLSGAMAGAGALAYASSGLGRIGPVDKVVRRLDHILAVDPSTGGLLRGLGEAAKGLSKRGLSNHALSDAVAS
jgi:CelD/BcsL family acetyltransferase involved in cellulose biosynthesis